MSNKNSLESIAQSIISSAKPKESIEVMASRSTSTQVVVYQGEVESLTQATDGGLGVRVIIDGKVGFSTVSSLDKSLVARCLQSARENTVYSTYDPYATFAEPDAIAYPAMVLLDPKIPVVPTELKVSRALELEKIVLAKDRRVTEVPQAQYSDYYGESVIASTNGIFGRSENSYAIASATTVAREGEQTHTGYGYSVSRYFDEVSLESAASDAVTRAIRLLGAKKTKSRSLTVVLEPRAASTLFALISASLSAEAIQRKRSIFVGRMGEPVASEVIDIVDDPTDVRFQSASPFDAEGLASRPVHLIEDGTLKNFLYDSYTANKDGITSTANAIRGGFSGTPSPGPKSILLKPGRRSQDEIIATIEEGVLVQSLSGVHSGINPVSGDFSVGAEGLIIRDGSLAEAVREVTISSTLQKMLLDVVEVGNDTTFLPSIAAGNTVVIGKMNLSGE